MARPVPEWHALSAADVARAFSLDPARGLSDEEVADARASYGANELGGSSPLRLARVIARLLSSPLSLVLIAVGAAAVFLAAWVDVAVIAVVLLVNVLVGTIQEGRARHVFETLATSQRHDAVVLRNGIRQVIPAREIVPGDVLIIEGGKAIAADARLIAAADLAVNEAALTGEWIAVHKQVDPVRPHASISEQDDMVWSGTTAVAGFGTAIVVATGKATALGHTAAHLHDDDAESTLQQSVSNLARILMICVGVAVCAITAIGLAQGIPFASIILTGIALGVAVMPEGLPAAVTIVLAVGVETILKHGGLVRNLNAAETLGSTTYIITDKTGTLTTGQMSLAGLYSVRGMAKQDTSLDGGDNHALLAKAILASDAFVVEHDGELAVEGRPIERALVMAGLRAGIAQQELFASGHARRGFLQFEASRRYAVSRNETERGDEWIFTGSPEILLAASSRVLAMDGARELEPAVREKFEAVQRRESAHGNRFIGIATATAPREGGFPDGVRLGTELPQLTFVGMIAFADTVRPDAAAEIASAQAAGLRVIMATGDYAETARIVARAVGIDAGSVVSGPEAEALDDAKLLAVLRGGAIFARVLPEQKLRMVRVLRDAGETVAMTGDGVNDAPALVSADIGIAIGSGTDVAKEAADIVLLGDSFSVIPAAIEEGRRIGDNLRKIVGYLLSTSFSELFIIAASLVAHAALPLLPTQILWANVIQEGIMTFPFAFEPAERDVMRRTPRKAGEEMVLTSSLKKLIVFTAIMTGLVVLCLYAILAWLGTALPEIRTVLFVALTLDSLLYVFAFKDLHRPIWRIDFRSNRLIVLAAGTNFLILMASLTLPPLRSLLTLAPLTIVDLALLVLLACANLATIETAKALFFRNETAHARTPAPAAALAQGQ
ncbi:MAG TPA: HAD-IC family P-type ATPase [Candidatus Paceibacterota bacterium]|nr:HAD-IC family P-type ATPase [Candidatus Paceibacterota bacterium]